MKVRVLIVEDDSMSAKYAALTLISLGYELVGTASNMDQALEFIRDKPDLVMMDIDLGAGPNGIEVAGVILSRTDVPILFLTDKADVSPTKMAHLKGSFGFLQKPLTMRAMHASIEMAIRQHARMSSLEQTSRVDHLTQCWNRKAFLPILQRFAEAPGGASVLMIDIDHFKSVNDVHGHKGGDTALVEVARRLRKNVRQYDSVGRWGGEEFIVAISDCSITEAVGIGERLRHEICVDPVELETVNLRITASVGVSTVQKDETIEACIHRADQLLYKAKREGRNRVCSG